MGANYEIKSAGTNTFRWNWNGGELPEWRRHGWFYAYDVGKASGRPKASEILTYSGLDKNWFFQISGTTWAKIFGSPSKFEYRILYGPGLDEIDSGFGSIAILTNPGDAGPGAGTGTSTDTTVVDGELPKPDVDVSSGNVTARGTAKTGVSGPRAFS